MVSAVPRSALLTGINLVEKLARKIFPATILALDSATNLALKFVPLAIPTSPQKGYSFHTLTKLSFR